MCHKCGKNYDVFGEHECLPVKKVNYHCCYFPGGHVYQSEQRPMKMCIFSFGGDPDGCDDDDSLDIEIDYCPFCGHKSPIEMKESNE